MVSSLACKFKDVNYLLNYLIQFFRRDCSSLNLIQLALT